MRTELGRRIGGEMVRVRVGVGVMEAALEVFPEWAGLLAALQRGHHRAVRAVITAGAREAGRENVDDWYDGAVERCGVAPFTALAFEAMSDAFAKAADASAASSLPRENGEDKPGFDVRAWISMAAAMGWTPGDLRAASLSDLIAAVDGYLKSKGVGGDDALSRDDVAELQALLEDDD